MRFKKVTSKEVKMHFLLAEEFKGFFERQGTLLKPSINELNEAYNKIWMNYYQSPERELDDKMKSIDPTRLQRYDSLDWRFGNVSLDNIGPWPEMDGLDIKLTTGNFTQTVIGVQKVWAKESNLNVPAGFKEKIQSIIAYKEFIMPRFPIILFSGGIERANHNNWVKNSGEIPKDKQKDWLCKIFLYDNDAGNSRAFAYSLLGLKKVGAYIGKRM